MSRVTEWHVAFPRTIVCRVFVEVVVEGDGKGGRGEQVDVPSHIDSEEPRRL